MFMMEQCRIVILDGFNFLTYHSVNQYVASSLNIILIVNSVVTSDKW
jgi:hypothetical protein